MCVVSVSFFRDFRGEAWRKLTVTCMRRSHEAARDMSPWGRSELQGKGATIAVRHAWSMAAVLLVPAGRFSETGCWKCRTRVFWLMIPMGPIGANFFVLVDSQHTECPRWFFVLGMYIILYTLATNYEADISPPANAVRLYSLLGNAASTYRIR